MFTPIAQFVMVLFINAELATAGAKAEGECTDYYHCKHQLTVEPDYCEKPYGMRLCPVSCGCPKCIMSKCDIDIPTTTPYWVKDGFFNCSDAENSFIPMIPKWLRCDGKPDCRDKSDEENCEGVEPWTEPTPPPRPARSFFICSDVEPSCLDLPFCVDRIPSSWRCNGFSDCKDQSDEENCEDVPIVRKDEFFTCEDGERIPLMWKCDDMFGCHDKSDCS